MVSGEGGFHEMYTEVEDVLCAVVGIGLPVGAVSKARREKKKKKKKEEKVSISMNVGECRRGMAKNFDCHKSWQKLKNCKLKMPHKKLPPR